MSPDQRHAVGRLRAWAVWAMALSVYVLAVFHRSSLGVAGLHAANRFGINATELAAFTVLQLLVYSVMQLPVGIALDRFGSRAMLLSGLALMTGGQMAFAFVDSFPLAVLARGLLGAGDAMVFTSVLRLVTVWFLVRQAPLVTQLTGQVGQLGAIVAAAPLSYALHAWGWTPAFALASSSGVVLMVAVALVVRDSPYRIGVAEPIKFHRLARTLRAVWGNPGTRLGFWTHFVSQFSVTVFTLLWGFPFLVRGQGLTPEQAATLLMAMTAWGVVSALGLGWLVTRFPYYRSVIVVVVVATMALFWAFVLLRTTPAPMWLLVLMVFGMASGGPASMVGFGLARSFSPLEVVGRANGLVNIGGFSASLLTMALVGLVLDLREPAGQAAYDLGDFRAAMSVQFLFWSFGILQVLRYRRIALAQMDREQPGAVQRLRQGETIVHPGWDGRKGI